MPIQVSLREDESFEDLLDRFNNAVRKGYGRPWCKKRFGYYEKPSALKRKQNKMDKLRHGNSSLKLHIQLEEQFSRTGPTIAAGK